MTDLSAGPLPKVKQMTDSFLLTLLRLSLHPSAELSPTPPDIDWSSVRELASAQKVTAIAWDGYARLYEAGMVTVDMDRAVKKEWLATVLQSFDQYYPRYRAAIGKLASFYAKHGIRMMVLKGYGLSLNYPVPMHRPCGDVDFWNFGEYERADKVLEEGLGIPVNRSHHHHTTFHIDGLLFENHYDFVNVHAHPSSKVVEARLKELAGAGEETVDIDGHQIFLPSPDFNALFLLRHTAAHFAAAKTNLRQILDWGTFVQKYHDRVDWNGLEAFVDSVGMLPFYQILNGICVDYLGFEAGDFPGGLSPAGFGSTGRHPDEARVMEDVLCPEFTAPCPSFLLSQWLWRYRRWRAGSWKHRLVYPESLLRTFLVQLKSHLMKPAEMGKIG